MLPLSPSFSFLAAFFVIVLDKNVAACPPPLQPPSRLLTIPISRPNFQDNTCHFSHGTIVQQHHINRGVRRLAMMTGVTPPPKHVFQSAVQSRLSLLPKEARHEYELDTISGPTQNPASQYFTARAISAPTPSSSIPYATPARGATSHSIGLDIEANDIGYMGTPPKDFRLLIDSGSADMWVGGEGCRGNDGGVCGAHTFLGPLSSRSFNASTEEWAIGYVSGSVSGVLVEDNVSIAGLALKGHKFGVALNESSDFTPDNIPFDGILGFAKHTISLQRTPTLLQSLVQASLVPAPIVSYKIPRLADGKNDGELTLGGMVPDKYDSKTLVKRKNVNKFGFWGISVDAVKVGKKDMHWSNRTVVLDTGTTLIIAPQADVEAIHQAIPGARYDGGGWTVPCNVTTSLSFTIGGRSFPIDPRDVAFYPMDEDSTECMSGIAVGGVGPFYLNNEWLVGDVFLKNIYFSTDESKDEVSIAQLRP